MALKAYRISRSRKLLVAATRSAPRTYRVRHSAAAGQRTGPIHPAESFVPAKTFREKEILPTSSGGEGENDIRKDVRPRDDSS